MNTRLKSCFCECLSVFGASVYSSGMTFSFGRLMSIKLHLLSCRGFIFIFITFAIWIVAFTSDFQHWKNAVALCFTCLYDAHEVKIHSCRRIEIFWQLFFLLCFFKQEHCLKRPSSLLQHVVKVFLYCLVQRVLCALWFVISLLHFGLMVWFLTSFPHLFFVLFVSVFNCLTLWNILFLICWLCMIMINPRWMDFFGSFVSCCVVGCHFDPPCDTKHFLPVRTCVLDRSALCMPRFAALSLYAKPCHAPMPARCRPAGGGRPSTTRGGSSSRGGRDADVACSGGFCRSGGFPQNSL